MINVEINKNNQVVVDLDNFFNSCVELDCYDKYFDIITDYIDELNDEKLYNVEHPDETLFLFNCKDNNVSKMIEEYLNTKFSEIDFTEAYEMM